MTQQAMTTLGHSQYNPAVAGGWMQIQIARDVCTHPLPRVVLTVSRQMS